MEVVITNNIPVPPAARKGRQSTDSELYPLHRLEVGDSFGVDKDKRNSLQGTVARYSKRTGKKFTVRVGVSQENPEVIEARVWRLS